MKEFILSHLSHTVRLRRSVLLVVVLLSIATTAWAEVFTYTYEGTTLSYTSTGDKTCEVTSIEGTLNGQVIIPSRVNSSTKFYSVTSIGDHAFRSCDKLTSVAIPTSVTAIGAYSFASCENLTSVKIPESITSISTHAFYKSSNLTAVYISSLENWCRIAFTTEYSNPLWYENKLYLNGELVTHLIIPESITEIKQNAFVGCTGLTALTIPNSVTKIGDSAFSYCTGLTSVIIPNSVTIIGEYSFSGCSGLKSLTIGNSVTSIRDNAFDRCSGLTSVTIPNSVTFIGNFVFRGCTGLKSLTIGNSVTSINGQLFYGCSGLTSITIPESVTLIGVNAFDGCSGLTSITIPNSVKTIGNEAFARCKKLSTVEYRTDSPINGNSNWFSTEAYNSATLYLLPDGVEPAKDIVPWGLFTHIESIQSKPGDQFAFTYQGSTLKYEIIDDKTCKVIGYEETNSEVIIPSMASFLGNTYLVKSIGKEAFQRYSNLASVTIPESVTFIDEYAFAYCNNLNYVKIPESITAIGTDAFSNPGKFMEVHISSLESWCKIDFATKFSNPVCSTPVYPGHDLYLNGELITHLIIPTSITKIKQYTFAGCACFTAVTIHNSVTSIGEGSFRDCYGPTSVSIPESVTSIGEYAFAYCLSLTSITIPESVTSIGEYAFAHCSSLISITIPESITEIRASTFAGCSNLTSITIPKSVTKIGRGAFSICSGLTSITIPESVTRIGQGAFRECSSLASITIPESVTEIGYEAFGYCKSLISITIPKSVTEIGEKAFSYCSSLTSVYYGCNDPITVDKEIFSSDGYEATLYVPEAAVEKCKTIKPWKNFKNIQAYAFSGIDEIATDKCSDEIDYSAPYTIHSLTGMKLHSELDNLSPDLYIVSQGNKVKKIVVK